MTTDKAFPLHRKRVVHSLGGIWKFAFLGDIDIESVRIDSMEFPDRMLVPAAFDALPAWMGQRGVAVYRRTVLTTSGRRRLLHFEAVSLWCRAFVDGKALADHSCGYTGFWCDAGASTGDSTEITVIVDNRFDWQRIPLHEQFFDFYQWGGITRSAWLHEVPDTYIRSAHVRVDDVVSGKITVAIKLSASVTEVTTATDATSPITHAASGSEFSLALTVPRALPWSPESPHLHTLAIGVGEDDYIVRFGLRTIRAAGREILLNERPIKLLGFNRHEFHPHTGSSLSPAQHLIDIQLLKELGCNFVRGSHYPQDQHFLDLCDELGILVWEEGLGWGQRERQLTDPHFRSAHLEMLGEMVDASINHPSVIIWGFLNEAGTNEESTRPIFEESVALLRVRDPSRLVTCASMFPLEDRFYGLVDIISNNLYPGWYGADEHPDPLSLILPKIRECLAYVATFAKPYVISETGAEALYGFHDPLNGFFTEEYQAEYLRVFCDEVVSSPGIVGLAIWHFSDTRVDRNKQLIRRPRGFNNKGTFDEYRRPKAACAVIRDSFSHRQKKTIGDDSSKK